MHVKKQDPNIWLGRHMHVISMWLVLIAPLCYKHRTPFIDVDGGDHDDHMAGASLFPSITGNPCGDCMHVTCSEFPIICLDWFGLTGLYWPFSLGWCNQNFARVFSRHLSGLMLSFWQWLWMRMCTLLYQPTRL